jgi:hypothetical protein
MGTSTRFKELRSRLSELRRHLLPAKFSPTGTYSDYILDRARGYRLLAHAEIESYLEDVSRAVVTDAIRSWKKHRKSSSLLISFLACYHSSWSVDDTTHQEEIIRIAKSRNRLKDSVDEIIDLAQTQFIQIIQNNNGIKQKNFKSLVLPTGVDVDKLDQTWLTNLDEFGKLRGDIAHNAKKATGQINPADEYGRIRALLGGLQELDKQIIQVRAEIT